jgi:hypothetical protein
VDREVIHHDTPVSLNGVSNRILALLEQELMRTQLDRANPQSGITELFA